MKEVIKYPSIDQYRHVVKQVISNCEYHGVEKPTLKFKGFVKVHGTNAGVCYDPKSNEMWVQSRKNIITIEKDNAGFAFFVEGRKDLLTTIFKNTPNEGNEAVSVFGEFCGGNIQKGVAITGLDKMFIVFGIKVGDKWLPVQDLSSLNEDNIYSINQFPSYEVEIDFNYPDLVTNKLTEITEQVEEECPIGKHFGITGVGEGIVWSCNHNGQHLMFKVKGDKHSVSKVKKLAKVDTERVESVRKFVDMVVTEQRLNQGIEYVFTMENKQPNVKSTGDFLRWIIGDIVKEEMDTMLDNNLEPKDVNKYIATTSRTWFMKYLDTQAGL